MNVDVVFSIFKYAAIFVAGVSGVLGIVKTTHDKKTSKLTKWGKIYLAIILTGIVVALGTQISEDIGQANEKKSAKKERNEERAAAAREREDFQKRQEKITKLLEDQKETNRLDRLEANEKFQRLLAQYNAAKTGDSLRIATEKVRTLERGLDQWAANVEKNLLKTKVEWEERVKNAEEAKTEETNADKRKQIKGTQESIPVIAFAVRTFENAMRAYSKKTGKEISIEEIKFPENFYKEKANGVIRFTEKAIWNYGIVGETWGRQNPERVYRWPYFRISFVDSGGKPSGTLTFATDLDAKKFSVSYDGIAPNPMTVSGNYDISEYETPVLNAIQIVVEFQLTRIY